MKLDSGQEGYVVDFSWRSTRLRMLANNLIVVPNAKLAQAIVVNHHLPSQDLAVLVDVGRRLRERCPARRARRDGGRPRCDDPGRGRRAWNGLASSWIARS
jgi:hypothetical protein